MRSISPFLLAICLATITYGQSELKISSPTDTRLIQVLNNAELISENNEEWLSVKIYKIDNGPGSTGFQSSEVSHNLLIAVSEIDEAPNQNLFEIGPFYNPRFVKWTEEKGYQKEYEIEYGAYDNRKALKLIVNIEELKYEK